MEDELKSELAKIEKMSVYERMTYIHDLVEFYKQMGECGKEAMDALCNRIMFVTKGYKK